MWRQKSIILEVIKKKTDCPVDPDKEAGRWRYSGGSEKFHVKYDEP